MKCRFVKMKILNFILWLWVELLVLERNYVLTSIWICFLNGNVDLKNFDLRLKFENDDLSFVLRFFLFMEMLFGRIVIWIWSFEKWWLYWLNCKVWEFELCLRMMIWFWKLRILIWYFEKDWFCVVADRGCNVQIFGVIRLGMCGCSIIWGYKVGVCPGY